MPAAVRFAAAFATFVCALASQNAPPPPEADHLLAAMHDYAAHYVATLPDFLCLQTTDQSQSGRKGDNWKRLDSITSKLVFANGQEHRTLELVNGHKPNPLHYTRRPLVTNGEFAILISKIFSEASQADFIWQGWESLRGQRCAVFRYRIDRNHSSMKLGLSDLASAIVPYGGLVFADPATGSIRRVTSEARDLPAELRTRSIATAIDYWPVTIGSNLYLLPSDASVEVETPTGRIRNDLHFRDYQKFEAQSTVTFDSNDDPADKLPHPPLL